MQKLLPLNLALQEWWHWLEEAKLQVLIWTDTKTCIYPMQWSMYSSTGPPSATPHTLLVLVVHISGLCQWPANLPGQYGYPGMCRPLFQSLQVCGIAQTSVHQGDAGWSTCMAFPMMWCLTGATICQQVLESFLPTPWGHCQSVFVVQPWVEKPDRKHQPEYGALSPMSCARHLVWLVWAVLLCL